MSLSNVLIQLDPDDHASVFDAVVAVDAGVEHLLQYHSVQPDQVQGLVHGAMFTRGPKQLHHTAVFVGGTNVAAGERLLQCVRDAFFGPLRVSVLMDANGANTTAAAAVLAAARHTRLAGSTATVLAATGPVGQRACWLLAREGVHVRMTSRSLERAEAAREAVAAKVPEGSLKAFSTDSPAALRAALGGSQIVIAAGAAGVELLPHAIREQCPDLRVAIDLNAVPPAGIAGIEIGDRAVERQGMVCYGALGVGGTKMKIHSTAIARLFQSNDQVLDAEEIYAIGRELES
jgi:hypothetical protein